MNALIVLTLLAVTPTPSTNGSNINGSTTPLIDARVSAPTFQVAQVAPTSDDEVAPLPAVSPDTSNAGGIPLDDSVVGEAPPIFNAPRAEAEATPNDDWVAPYVDDGTLSEQGNAYPMWLAAAAQVAIGTGIGLLFAPPALALISASTVLLPNTLFEGLGNTGMILVGVLGVVGATTVVAPGIIAASQTLVGDWLSDQRSALVWPLLTSYIIAGSTWMTAAISVSATVGAIKAASRQGEQVDAITIGLVALLAPAVAGMVLTAVAPVVTYYVAGEDKRIGDDGRGLPGLLQPAHAQVEIPPGPHPRAPVVVIHDEARAPLSGVRF